MRIVVDLQSAQSGSRLGGIGRYSLELAKAMVLNAPDDDFIVVLNDKHPEHLEEFRAEFRQLVPPDAMRILSLPKNCDYHTDKGASAYAAELIREQFLIDLNPDIVHVTSLFEGYYEQVATSVNRSGQAPTTAVTLYDLIPLSQSDKYLADDVVKVYYLKKFHELKKSDVILAISEFSAQECLELIENYSGTVVDIRGGVDSSFRVVPNATELIAPVVKRCGITKPIILYAASFDQRKNQARLIEAFATLPLSVREAHQLVIVGGGWPAIYDQLYAVADTFGLRRNSVVFTGRVEDDELIGLYNHCTLFVFPSLWEGLGMPVLEAMACGAPVIASNTTSLPEVVGWPEACFDPTNVNSIADKMEQALTDESFRSALKVHGVKHAAGFTWQESARRALKALNSAHPRFRSGGAGGAQSSVIDRPRRLLAEFVSQGRFTEERIWEFAACLAANELEARGVDGTDTPRLGWVTSWNTRCGIASYSANILRHISWPTIIFASVASDLESPDGSNVVRSWSQGKDCGLEVLMEKVKDSNLTDIVVQFNYGFYNFEALNRFFTSQVMLGRRVYIVLHSTSDAFDFPGHRLIELRAALAAASIIFVHSGADIQRLNQIGIRDGIELLPQGVRLIPGARQKPRDGKTVIGCYGFFLPNKGLPELIEAIAFLRENGRDVELKLVNADYGDVGGVSKAEIGIARARAIALNIEAHVEFQVDYLDDEQSIAFLRETDLIVYPYQRTGESSSAAVRMGLASGVPVAVTPLTIFDDLGDAAYRLPGTTPIDIASGIVEILDTVQNGVPAINSREAAARAWCKSHDVRRVANQFRRLLERRAFTETWRTIYEADFGVLPTRNVSYEGDILRTTARGGVFAYGPYISLAAGLYRLVVCGSEEIYGSEGGHGCVSLTAGFGTITIDEIEFGASNEGVLVDRLVLLERDLDHVEVVLASAEGRETTVTGYRLIRRYGSI